VTTVNACFARVMTEDDQKVYQAAPRPQEKRITPSSCLILVCLFCFADIRAALGQQGPSLEETANWLVLRLPEARAHWTQLPDRPGVNYHQTSIGDVSLVNCSLQYTEESRIFQPNLGPPTTTVYRNRVSIPLGQVSSAFSAGYDPATGKTEPVVISYVAITTKTEAIEKTCLEQPSGSWNPCILTRAKGTSFFVDQADFASRLAKAISHARQLCGGKPEAPEPF
jgi:hypothetical protein